MSDSLYPRSPVDVPVDYIQPSKAYKRHAWFAVAGLVGFFLLYIGATAWFGWKMVALSRAAYASGSPAGWVGAFLAAFFFVFLAKALLPSKRGAAPERIEISPADQPKLFEFVYRIADEARAPRPHKVFVSPDVNAAVFYPINLTSLLFPSRKNLLIGVGLVNVLTLAEFKAVLAHEFGHFAQRAMAVGRWVYVGQQVAGRIIARRDIIDRFLGGISQIDIRIAWIGWLLRLVAWSIRALTETFFRLVVVAERALSREMELQADRVSVSVAGSDALVHGLFRLRAADTAWSQAEGAAAQMLGQGKRPPDLFALQDLALGELRRIFGEVEFGDVPPLPAGERASHRIFTPQLAQPPVMWSTHPPSHEREINAKEPYIPAPLDDRSAWCLFEDAAQLKAQLTARELETWGAPEDAALVSVEESLALAGERFDKGWLEARYHGLYLGREITRQSAKVPGLFDPIPTEREAIAAVLEDPYPESISDVVQSSRDLQKEKAQLEALERGVADAPGQAIQYRGRTLKRKELREVIATVTAELHQTRTQLHGVDRRLRTAHWAAAAALGEDWANLHSAQLGLLHFAEHMEGDLDDAMGHLYNVFEVVTADGRVTDAEIVRLLASAHDVYDALNRVSNSRNAVLLGPAVAAAMRVDEWPQAFEEDFGLLPPARANIESWLSVVESWFHAYSGLLGRLREAALEVLLDVEGHVRRCWLEGKEAGAAPQGPVIQASYPAFLEGGERELQRELGWWDRFVIADGWGPGAARLVVASSIVGVATFAGVGGGVVTPTVSVHNGLQHEVFVTVGDVRRRVAPMTQARFDLDLENLVVQAETVEGDIIERFTPTVDNRFADYAYSVAGAVPLVQWTVVYGSDREPDPVVLGPERWLEANVDHVFEEPPRSVQSSTDTVSRQVLTAVDAPDIPGMYAVISMLDPERRRRVALLHGRWDDLPMGAWWLAFAHGQPGAEAEAEEILAARRAASSIDHPPDLLLERLAQDFAPEGDRSVCDAHEERWALSQHDGDAAYLALRCRPEDEATARAILEAFEAHPQHGWLMASAGFAHYRLGDFAQAVDLLGRARRSLPSMAEGWAPTEARLRRYQARTAKEADLHDLEEASIRVRMLVADETGGEGGSRAIDLLGRGSLAEAVRAATGEGIRARVLRQAALSEGATPALLQEAGELVADGEMSVADAIAGITIARRLGNDPAPYEAVVRETLEPDDAEVVLAYADAERLGTELEALEPRRKALEPELRGYAALLGMGVLGEDAPAHWQGDARRFLFAGERPFLGRSSGLVQPDSSDPVTADE